MYCKLGRKGCLTIDAALRPVLWTGLDITTILLQKQYNIISCGQQGTFVHFTVMNIEWEYWSIQNSVVMRQK